MKRFCFALLAVHFFALAAAAQSGGTVWFYRTKDAGESIPQRRIYETTFPTRHVATLAAGEYFGLSVTAGTHTFSYTSAPARGQTAIVPIEAGQHVYVRIGADSINLVSQAEGVRALQDSRSIGSLAAIDNSVIVGMALPAVTPAAANTTRAAFLRPAAAAAQMEQGAIEGDIRRFEFGINPYSYLQMVGEDFHGFNANLGIHFFRNVALIADFSLNRTSVQEFFELARQRDEVFAYRFGPRFTARNGRASIFAQVLIGGHHVRSIVDAEIFGAEVREVETEHGWAGLAGGGIDIGLVDWMSLRAIQAEYNVLENNGGFGHGARIGFGLVFHLH